MKDITVLLTRIGSIVSPSYISTLRNVKERKIKIIGVDINKGSVGASLVDKFYQVPTFINNWDEYCNKIIELSQDIDVIIPSDESESLEFRKRQESFDNIKTFLACPDIDTLEKASSKKDFYDSLKAVGLPCPEFYTATNFEELESAARKLNYPEKEIIIKPSMGVAGRGFRIVSNKVDRLDLLYNKKPAENNYTTLEELRNIMGDETFPETIVSEYLSGKREYSVDTISKNGEVIVSIPKLRISTILGASSTGQVSLDNDIQECVESIIRKLNFNSNVNIQFKENDRGELIPYEANPRIAGTISLCDYAGANLLYYGVKLALGESIPKNKIKDKAMIRRYLGDHFSEE